MIVQEIIWAGTVKTYSDAGKYIIQSGTGDKYEEAIDPISANRWYTESDELIPVEEQEEENNG